MGRFQPIKENIYKDKKREIQTKRTSHITNQKVAFISYKTFLDYITIHKSDAICTELLRNAEDKKRHWRNPIMKTLEIINRILEIKK